MIVAILTAVALLALAMFLVAWAKYLEEKEKAESIEKELEQSKAREQCSAQAVLWYAEQLTNAKQEAEGLRMGVDYLGHREDVLQDKLSAALCPTNNHVWVNGVCKKCGRIQK